MGMTATPPIVHPTTTSAVTPSGIEIMATTARIAMPESGPSTVAQRTSSTIEI